MVSRMPLCWFIRRIQAVCALFALRTLLRHQVVSHRIRRDQVTNEALVIRAHGTRLSGFVWKVLLPRYSRQLAQIGVSVTLMYDLGNVTEEKKSTSFIETKSLGEDEAVRNYSVGVQAHATDTDRHYVNVCQFSRDTAKQSIGVNLFKGPLGTQHSAHDHMLVMWWRHCRQSVGNYDKLKYVWFVEADAFFNGDVASFVEHFANYPNDLIAGGFRVAGKHWWKWSKGYFKDAIRRGLPLINRSSPVVDNVPLLPRYAGKDTKGLLFFQDHVMRVSAGLLTALDTVVRNGMIGGSEAFVASICAAGLGFDPSSKCRIFDFSPVQDRKNGSKWTAPRAYSWNQNYWPDKLNRHCKNEKWRDKWIHRVKLRPQPNYSQIECI
eukprot:TRINITY_DN3595_c0_g2_i1.p1 TRINITY_DN3595_c0_g2~~TRINITY_DN3595_c0_g2_i1.p1  ORF type:complete len:392 (-),score=26.49 TRINITY_DN3595_c0_g2_i1:195-1331(-)